MTEPAEKLPDAIDPSLWAEAFLDRFEVRARDDFANDDDPQEFMARWFAGAITAGHDAGKDELVATIRDRAIDKLEAERKWARAVAGTVDSTSATERPTEETT